MAGKHRVYSIAWVKTQLIYNAVYVQRQHVKGCSLHLNIVYNKRKKKEKERELINMDNSVVIVEVGGEVGRDRRGPRGDK